VRGPVRRSRGARWWPAECPMSTATRARWRCCPIRIPSPAVRSRPHAAAGSGRFLGHRSTDTRRDLFGTRSVRHATRSHRVPGHRNMPKTSQLRVFVSADHLTNRRVSRETSLDWRGPGPGRTECFPWRGSRTSSRGGTTGPDIGPGEPGEDDSVPCPDSGHSFT
jgi:hypothetical protein